MASSNISTMRPRANTLSHVDAATIGMLANTQSNMNRHFVPGHSHHNSIAGLSTQEYGFRSMNAHNGISLPKLETGLPSSLSGGLRTAPPYGGFGSDYSMDFSSGNTINPHALHMSDSNPMVDPSFQQMFYASSMPMGMTDSENAIDWMARGFESHMNFNQVNNENAIDDSSPSAMSTNSPTNGQDLMAEMQPNAHVNAMTNNQLWQQAVAGNAHMVNSPMSMDFNSNFNDMINGVAHDFSPKPHFMPGSQGIDINLPTPPDLVQMDPVMMQHGMIYNSFQLPPGQDSGNSSASTASMDSSMRQSSVTTQGTDLVNDSVRNTLITGLSQSNPFSHRKYSQSLVSSSPTIDNGTKSRSFNGMSVPSTQDLQRYVAAYVKYFHPHLPFLHIASLNFESHEYAMPTRLQGNSPQFAQHSMAGGGSCLVLSMAAIGAVYERELDQSRELFQWAHRFIFSYLELRRKADMHRTQFAPRHASESEETPLWLVQAMLLHVIYGHNCGDKTAAEVASNHCSSLVSLARDAHLARPAGRQGSRRGSPGQAGNAHGGMDVGGWTSMLNETEEVDWIEWRMAEERKRTLYAVFLLSSMLVMAYNHAPALTNSEIRLELPCDEELWSAESAQAWQALGGGSPASSKQMTFASALSHLLMSSQRQRRKSMSMNQNQPQPAPPGEGELRPSTFGCLILVNALHNYIWETRQRHLGRQWTAKDTEQMHAHIEPALRAWEAAWASNPSHSLERPNPFGAGPLSADSVPLLDLAYVRLYINLGRSKEAFWQRDYISVAEEVARSPEIGGSPVQHQRRQSICQVDGQEPNAGEIKPEFADPEMSKAKSTRRERQLRRAAFYAADSLLMSDKLGLIFEESNYRELTAQSALCAFDCAQVLAEWVTTVQERVGKYVGTLGQDEVDLFQVPGILLVEDEDRQLLHKIEEFITRTEQKLGMWMQPKVTRDGGYSPCILQLTAQLLERAAVWPGK
jgi:hypothetical protein